MIWYDEEELEGLNGWDPNDVGELFEDKKTGRVFELTEVEVSLRRIWLEEVGGEEEMIYAEADDLPRDRFWLA